MEPPSSMRTDISAGAPPNSDSTHTPDLTISQRLRDEHGYSGKYTIVKDYVRERSRHTREMFVPLSHAPGRDIVKSGV